jgi:hypothetical protein
MEQQYAVRGMKVVPFQKTAWSGLEHSNAWNSVKDTDHPYLYLKGKEYGDSYALLCQDSELHGGDFFNFEDFEPYISEGQLVKVVDVGDRDAWYTAKEKVIGKVGILVNVTYGKYQKGYYGGYLRDKSDRPLNTFLAVKVVPVDKEIKVEENKGMDIKDVKIGMKVVPFRKSWNGGGREKDPIQALADESAWNDYGGKKQGFMYVAAIMEARSAKDTGGCGCGFDPTDESEGAWPRVVQLSERRDAGGGNYFLAGDFTLYNEPAPVYPKEARVRVRYMPVSTRAEDAKGHTDIYTSKMQLMAGQIFEATRRSEFPEWYNLDGESFEWHRDWLDFNVEAKKPTADAEMHMREFAPKSQDTQHSHMGDDFDVEVDLQNKIVTLVYKNGDKSSTTLQSGDIWDIRVGIAVAKLKAEMTNAEITEKIRDARIVN